MSPREKINIFAFPSETIALFNLLALASIMLSLFLGNALGLLFNLGNSLASLDVTSIGVDSATAFLPMVYLSGFSLFAMLGFAYYLYLRHPSQIRKRRKILPVGEKDTPLYDQVNSLAAEAGVKTPLIEIAQGLRGTDAQAFGLSKPHSLALDGGLRILRKTASEVFNALIRHELAHVANEDIGRSYFSDALWRSIRWILGLPFLLGITGFMLKQFFSGIFNGNLINNLSQSIPVAFSLFFQFGCVFAITGMIWARLLRIREYHADLRAAFWGSENGLRTILNENAEKEKPASPFNFWANHPSAKERIRALDQPMQMFTLSKVLLFLGGLLLAFIFSGIFIEMSGFIVFSGFVIEARNASSGLFFWLARLVWFGGFIFSILFVFVPVAGLLNGTVLPQIQKQAIQDLVNNKHGFTPYMNLAFPAFLLIGGLEIGFILTPFDIFTPNKLLDILIEIFLVIPWLGCITWAYFSFLRFFTIQLTVNQIGKVYPVGRTRYMQIVSTLWAFLFFVPNLILSRTLDIALPIALGWLVFTIFVSPLLFLVTWGVVKAVFDGQRKTCHHCGKITSRAFPAIEHCEHCQNRLGEWLFMASSAE